ncbi:hypothetical protein ACJRO7_000316 [Eucalyptus globulus]|uniref:MLO-like protein n=1 Tax=Eucalyptus globulus TaxID=34317 RepID=A0ABD3LM83_EUCGL
MAVAGVDENSLEYTPTWVVAVVCFSILFISIVVDRFIRCAGQYLEDSKWWPLVGGSRKIKDELMLLGVISLLLTVFQTRIAKICISERLDNVLLPCKKPDSSSAVANFITSSSASSATRGRHLLILASDTTDYCSQKVTFPELLLLLLDYSELIIQWSMLEIYDEWSQKDDIQNVLTEILERYKNPLGSFRYVLVSILQKTFTSLTEHEYIALRQNFIAARNPKEPGKDFQKYIMRTLQKDFEKMMGIRWYLWLCAVVYLLVNVAGWNAHFWISFIPFTLTVIISIKLERMITQLAKEVAKKHKHDKDKSSENSAKDLVFKFSEDDFWFSGLKMVGRLLHIVLFVNSLELAFFFFIMFQYGLHSCIVGKVGFVVPRIVMGVIVQIVCSSRILPLHAIIQSQMHLEKKQSDKQKKIRKVRRHLEKYASDEEEEKEIVTSILVMSDNRKEPNSPEESTNIELARTDSSEGSVWSKVSDLQKKVSQGFISLMKQINSKFRKS